MTARVLWIAAALDALIAIGLHLFAGIRASEAGAEMDRLRIRVSTLEREADPLRTVRRAPSEASAGGTGGLSDRADPGTGSKRPVPPRDGERPVPPPTAPEPSESGPAATPRAPVRPPPDPAVILEILAKYADLVEEGKYAELYGYFTEDFRMQLMFSQGIGSAEDFALYLGALKRDEPFVFQGLARRLNPKILTREAGWATVEVDSPFSAERDTWYLKEDGEDWKLAAAAESPTAEIEHNETQARLILNLLAIAQLRFAETDPDRDGFDFATSIDELALAPGMSGDAPVLSAGMAVVLSSGADWGGYTFGIMPLEADGRSIDRTVDFAFWAAPVDYGRSGRRVFITRRGTGVLARDQGDGAPVMRWPGDPKSPDGWGE
ncbi:MAG: hypothetical protein HYY93_08155 [Planctomycetes bacterium]|nr:hypothetical protein [Planctomycetota bacterium]